MEEKTGSFAFGLCVAVGAFLQLRGTRPCPVAFDVCLLPSFLVGIMSLLLGAPFHPNVYEVEGVAEDHSLASLSGGAHPKPIVCFLHCSQPARVTCLGHSLVFISPSHNPFILRLAWLSYLTHQRVSK